MTPFTWPWQNCSKLRWSPAMAGSLLLQGITRWWKSSSPAKSHRICAPAAPSVLIEYSQLKRSLENLGPIFRLARGSIQFSRARRSGAHLLRASAQLSHRLGHRRPLALETLRHLPGTNRRKLVRRVPKSESFSLAKGRATGIPDHGNLQSAPSRWPSFFVPLSSAHSVSAQRADHRRNHSP